MKHIEQNYLAQKDISEAHRVFYQIPNHVWLSQKVRIERMIGVDKQAKTQIVQDAPSKTHIMR